MEHFTHWKARPSYILSSSRSLLVNHPYWFASTLESYSYPPNRMDSEPRAPIELRRRTPDEDQQLIALRDQDNKKFGDIGNILGRSVKATQSRYASIKQRLRSSFVDWIAENDHAIIDGRRRGLAIKDIADEMQLQKEAVSERWRTLQRQKQVPEDVLAIWRRKGDVVFTPEEDETILKIWMQMRDDEQLVRMAKFKGKSQADIRERRSQLVIGHSPLYQKMLGLGGKTRGETDALKGALGEPKHSWMK